MKHHLIARTRGRQRRAGGPWLSCVLLLPALAGCYSYRPATPAALAPDAEVRVTLTPDETVRLQPSLGVLKQRLEGRVVDGVGDDMVGLVVPQPASGPGSPGRLNSLVTLPQSSILLVETKQFSWAKTGLLAAAGAAVTVAVLAVTESSAGEGGETPPDNARISIPLRLIFR